jgi:hypothetical protein
MKSSAYPIRLIRMLVLGAIVAGTIASTADALRVVDSDGPSAQAARPFNRDTSYRDAARAVPVRLPDAFERYATAHPYGSGHAVSLPADRDASYRTAAQAVPVTLPDAFERYATAHPYGSGLAVSLPADRDTSYRAAARAVPVPLPDAFERFATAHPYGSGVPSISASPNIVTRDFDWGDWAIGIGTGMGLILLLAGGLGVGRQLRHRVQTA